MSGILIVDDSAISRFLLKKILEKNGYNVTGEAKNGKEAIDLYKANHPDVVILDIVMPEDNGVVILKKLLKYDKNASIIMCSSLAQQSIILDTFHLGAKSFIIKPFNQDILLETVEKITSFRKNIQDNFILDNDSPSAFLIKEAC